MAQPFPKLAEIIGPLASDLAETPALASSGIAGSRHILPRVEVGATGAHIVDALAVGEQRPLLVVDGRRLTVGEQLGSGAASVAWRGQGYWLGAIHRVTCRKFRGNGS
jgi:hypothetical protein